MHGSVCPFQDQLRVQRKADDAEHQRGQDETVSEGDLARGDAVRLAVVHCALVEAQRVIGRHRDPGDGDDGEDDLRVEEAVEDVELADEVGRSRHRQGRQGDDQEERRQDRRAHRHPAHLTQVLAAGPLRQDRDDHEQWRYHQAVVDHLQDRPVGPIGAEREDPGGDEAELRHRGVAGDQPHVGLGEGHHRAVEDRGEGDHQNHLLEFDRRVGKERQDDAQEAVCADLGQHPREDRQCRQRGGAVGVGHPAVQEEGGHLDQEGGCEEAEDPALAALAKGVLGEFGDREGDLPPVGGDDCGSDRRYQHQQRADQRVDDHLHRRRRGGRAIGPIASPDAEEEVERDQHQVEEEDEEEQVLGEERAQGGGLAKQQHQEEEMGALLLAEGGERRPRHPEDRGQ